MLYKSQKIILDKFALFINQNEKQIQKVEVPIGAGFSIIVKHFIEKINNKTLVITNRALIGQYAHEGIVAYTPRQVVQRTALLDDIDVIIIDHHIYQLNSFVDHCIKRNPNVKILIRA